MFQNEFFMATTWIKMAAVYAISMGTMLAGGYWLITYMRSYVASKARAWAPAHHQKKDFTPTMGGLIIIAATIISLLIGAPYKDNHMFVLIAIMSAYGIIGGLDDYYKIRYQNGISARTKFIAQWLIALLAGWALVHYCDVATTLSLPFIGYTFNIGWLFVAWAAFVIVSTSNAVNLTDGLDGLATSCLIPTFLAAGTFGILYFGFAPATLSIIAIALALIGALCGFLWFNTHPAQLFMGDVGSLSLGAALALLMLMAKAELWLIIVGAVFVIETLSVIVQVAWWKKTKVRLFRMAPLHHHLELSGWSETTITTRFALISSMLAMTALVLKIWLG